MLQLKTISKKTGFVLAIAGAAVVGGASTAFVSASIPGSDGTISACYNKTGGMLNVIDAEAGKTCTNKQNPISWSSTSGGGAAAVHDANGQLLGNLLDGLNNNGVISVYSPTLNRVVPLTDSNANQENLVVYPGFESAYFLSADCTGQAYVPVGPNVKTEVTRWHSGGNDVYATVDDNATTSSLTAQSALFWAADGIDNDFSCSSVDFTTNFYPLTTVSLPFNTPVQGPIKF